MNDSQAARELMRMARELGAEVGDVEIIEPTGSRPIRKKQHQKMKDAGAYSYKEPVKEAWKANILRQMEEIMTEGNGADAIVDADFLTYHEGSSNKFHFFVIFQYQEQDGTIVYVGGNAYGRIGGRAKIMVVAKSRRPGPVKSAVNQKMRKKMGKGYDYY